MLLTISQPAKTDFGGRTTHDFSPRIPLIKSRLSPTPKIDSPVSSLRASATTDSRMSTPHRGLPPPSAMNLPEPGRQPTTNPHHLRPGVMPAPPSQWQGQEESMRNWLVAKAEEDKRKQEEEKTKQESFRLEQRRIEQAMLHESLQAGMPPAMVPLIYAGIGNSNLAGITMESLHQYAAQLQAAQGQLQLQQQSPPEPRRETRMIGPGPSAQYSVPQSTHHHPQQVLLSQPSQSSDQMQQPAPLQTTFSAYQPAPGRPQPTSAPRSATHTQLPRLTTNEMYVHQPSQGSGGSAHPLHQSQTVHPEPATASPNIYFHHWVPPTESKSTNPQTPASKGEPHSAHPGSHLSESDYRESPRKRKAHGAHQPAPPPSGGPPQYTSPSFSNASTGSGGGRKSGGHARSRSNTSMRDSVGDNSRPASSSRRDRDPDPPRSSLPESGSTSEERSRPRHEDPLPAATAADDHPAPTAARPSTEDAPPVDARPAVLHPSADRNADRPDSRGDSR